MLCTVLAQLDASQILQPRAESFKNFQPVTVPATNLQNASPGERQQVGPAKACEQHALVLLVNEQIVRMPQRIIVAWHLALAAIVLRQNALRFGIGLDSHQPGTR
jgi:hypothetical protein